jgi:hypothetical protein
MARNGNIHPTRIFRTEEELEAVWIRYKSEVKNNPRTVIEYHGKDGDERVKPLERPLTFEGFKVFCWQNKIGNIEQYFLNKDELYGDFVSICSRIKDEIRTDQIEGGMVGQYNPSITQRLNGLVDKQENTIKGEPRIFNV